MILRLLRRAMSRQGRTDDMALLAPLTSARQIHGAPPEVNPWRPASGLSARAREGECIALIIGRRRRPVDGPRLKAPAAGGVQSRVLETCVRGLDDPLARNCAAC